MSEQRAEDAAQQHDPARPLVSVVVPTYRPGPALHAAVSSVVAQTEPAWELIVVDDGSGDDLTELSSLDDRVRVVRQTHAGVSAARNTGVARALGEWVAFLDDDDRWLPDKLHRQLDRLRGTGAALSHTAFEWLTETAAGTGSSTRRYPDEITYRAMLVGDHVCTSSVVVRRSVLEEAGGFATDLDRAEDLDLWLRLLRAGARFAVVDVPLLEYRTHADGASADYERTFRQRRGVLRRHLRAALRDRDRATARAARQGLRRGRELCAAQAFDAARATSGTARLRHLLRASARDPRFVADSWWQGRRSRRARTRTTGR